MTGPLDDLPPHIEESVRAIAALHIDHQRSASPLQRLTDRVVRFASRPRFAGVLLVLIAAWVGSNILDVRLTGSALDPPPFQWLQDGISVLALFLTTLILITQRREYQLEERRARLTLHLALLADQKNAKIIAMLDILMQSNAEAAKQYDPEATAMAIPADSSAVLSAIDRAHDDETS